MKPTFLLIFLKTTLFFIFFVSPLPSDGQNNKALENHQSPFIWTNAEGAGRNNYVYFRLDFNLTEIPSSVNFNLFADSRYHLYVNENFINYGPARFYPQHPEFDTYDITNYLKKGKNCIAVKVLSNGMYTFQIPLNIGGFTAWGQMQLKDGSLVKFNTPGNWKCIQCNAYDNESPKFSFAKAAIEIFDNRKDITDWNKINNDVRTWSKPVILTKQNAWGPLTQRCIPSLTQEETLPRKFMGSYSLNDDEEIHSFRLTSPDVNETIYNAKHRAFAYTYIYSQMDQKVKTGVWWGEYYLNGNGPLERSDVKPERLNRQEITLDLKKGWNFFFVKYDIVWAVWEFSLAVPKVAGLQFSPFKEYNSQTTFMTAGPFKTEEEDAVTAIPLPLKDPQSLPKLSAVWEAQVRNKIIKNPAIDIAWRYFDMSLPIDNSRVENIQVNDPAGSALVFDMGGKILGRLFIEYDAPAGTQFDIGFSEDMIGNRPGIMKRPGLYSAARVIADGKTDRWESFEPYGLRYLQINVSGNKDQNVRIKRIGVIKQEYPFTQRGSFECSDPMLNAIWNLGYRTLRVCAEDSYIDTPFRERGLYAGDALPEYAITLATSGDSRLIKRCLELFQDTYSSLFSDINKTNNEKVGDFPLLTLQYLRWYIDRTGDLDFANKLYQPYQNLLEHVLKNRKSDGLFEAGSTFIEWTKLDKKADLTCLHSLIASSFSNMAYISAKLGKVEDEKRYNLLSKEISTLVKTRFWDSNKKAFFDGFKNDQAIDHYYPISSAWPVLWNNASEEQMRDLRDFFDKELMFQGYLGRNGNVTPYGGFYILAALYKCGYADLAERFMRDYWSPMILKYDDTAWEDFDYSNDGGSTLSHAWSGGPTYFLTTQVLGINLGWPDPSDNKKIIIAPQSETINWAKGVIPYANSEIKIDWKINGDKLFINCDVPKGIEWEVKPKGRLASLELWINGIRKEK
jgi:alpha-L-rhamnosidase